MAAGAATAGTGVSGRANACILTHGGLAARLCVYSWTLPSRTDCTLMVRRVCGNIIATPDRGSHARARVADRTVEF